MRPPKHSTRRFQLRPTTDFNNTSPSPTNAAEFFQREGRGTEARSQAHLALEAYRDWGAHAKAEALKESLPTLLG